MTAIVEHPHVAFDQAAGRWYVEGSRVPAYRIFLWHQRGTTFEILFKRYPQLGPAKVLSAAAFFYDNPEIVEQEKAMENR